MPSPERKLLEILASGRHRADLRADAALLSDHLDAVRGRLLRDEFPQEAPGKRLARRGVDVLVVGDAHADPAHSNRRFDWLGRFIADKRPEVVVDIGDWFSMNSLNKYEPAGSRRSCEASYLSDILVGVDAMERVRAQLRPLEDEYQPRFLRTLGNHEARVHRALEEDPGSMGGLISTEHFMSSEFGWEQYEPGVEVVVNGLTLSHYYKSTRGNGGPVYAAAAAIRERGRSYAFGHSHRFRIHRQGDLMAVNVGCFFEHEETWLPPHEQERWDRGLCLLRDVYQGRFDVEFWSMRRLRRHYG